MWILLGELYYYVLIWRAKGEINLFADHKFTGIIMTRELLDETFQVVSPPTFFISHPWKITRVQGLAQGSAGCSKVWSNRCIYLDLYGSTTFYDPKYRLVSFGLFWIMKAKLNVKNESPLGFLNNIAIENGPCIVRCFMMVYLLKMDDAWWCYWKWMTHKWTWPTYMTYPLVI